MKIKTLLFFIIFQIWINSFTYLSSSPETIIHKADLKYYDGIPVLKLQGNYYEMGYQYGFLMKEKIIEIAGRFDDLVNQYISGLPFFQKNFAAVILDQMIHKMEKRLPQKYRDELKGLSDGTGIAYKKFVFYAFGGGLLSNAGCTTMFIRLNNRTVQARNFDFSPYFLGNYPIIIEYNPTGKFRYINFGIIGYPAMFQGINEQGISLALNYHQKIKTNNNLGLPMGYKIREILESCSTIAEVEILLKKFSGEELAWIVPVESAIEDKSAVFDITGNIISKSEFTEQKYKYALNRIFSHNRYQDYTNSKKYLDIAIGEGEENIVRELALNQIMNQQPVENIENIISILRNTSLYNRQEIFSGRHTIVCDRTIYSLIFDFYNHTVYFASNIAYSAFSNFYKFDLQTLQVSLFVKSAPQITSAEMKDYLNWFTKYQILFYTKHYQQIINQIDFNKINLSQLIYLYNIWNIEPAVINNTILLKCVNRLLTEHQDDAYLFLIKARLEMKINPEDAILMLKNTLNIQTLNKYNEIQAYKSLIEIYDQKNMKNESRYYVKKCLLLLKNLKKEYRFDHEIQQIYWRMKLRV